MLEKESEQAFLLNPSLEGCETLAYGYEPSYNQGGNGYYYHTVRERDRYERPQRIWRKYYWKPGAGDRGQVAIIRVGCDRLVMSGTCVDRGCTWSWQDHVNAHGPRM